MGARAEAGERRRRREEELTAAVSWGGGWVGGDKIRLGNRGWGRGGAKGRVPRVQPARRGKISRFRAPTREMRNFLEVKFLHFFTTLFRSILQNIAHIAKYFLQNRRTKHGLSTSCIEDARRKQNFNPLI
jgi:hypothetical protein